MNVVARRTLMRFWEAHPDARGPLLAWFAAARTARWRTPQDIRDQYGSADVLGDNRVVFTVGGDKYRLVARISYECQQVLIKFVGTRKDYDQIDVETV